MSKKLILLSSEVQCETTSYKYAVRVITLIKFAIVENGNIKPFSEVKIAVRRIYGDSFFDLLPVDAVEATLATVARDIVLDVKHEVSQRDVYFELWDYMFEESLFNAMLKALTPKTLGMMGSTNLNYSLSACKPLPAATGVKAELSALAQRLPGRGFKIQRCPADDNCPATYISQSDLLSVVIHLNDFHKWDRDKVADWADKLHDDGVVDLSFKEKDV